MKLVRSLLGAAAALACFHAASADAKRSANTAHKLCDGGHDDAPVPTTQAPTPTLTPWPTTPSTATPTSPPITPTQTPEPSSPTPAPSTVAPVPPTATPSPSDATPEPSNTTLEPTTTPAPTTTPKPTQTPEPTQGPAPTETPEPSEETPAPTETPEPSQETPEPTEDTPEPTETPKPTPPVGSIARYFSDALFRELFPEAAPLYSYRGLAFAVEAFPTFANSGDAVRDKRELAAFLAQTAHESDNFRATEEYGSEELPESQYCDRSNGYACAAGRRYHGRGAIQLSWNYNYYLAGEALGFDLLNEPELVSTDRMISWRTALWFWTTPQRENRVIHDVVTLDDGFAQSTEIINGGLECGPNAPNKVNELQRIAYYKRACAALGVEPVKVVSCNA